MGWSLLHPIAMTAILCAVFHEIFNAPIAYYAPFLLIGLACWNYVQSVTLTGCQCFFQGESYIRQYPAPLAIYPLRTVLAGCFHFLVALGLSLAVAWWFHGLGHPLALLSLVPTIVLLFVLGWALAVLAGLANVYFQDTNHLCQVGFQVLFYVTPIMYPPKALAGHYLGRLLNFNPLTSILEMLREPIMAGKLPPATTFAVAGATVAAAALLATAALVRLERRFIFHL